MTAWYHSFHEMIKAAQGTVFIVTLEQKITDKPTKRQLVVIANAWDQDDKVIGYCDHIGSFHLGNHQYASELFMKAEQRRKSMTNVLRELDIRYAEGIINKAPLAGGTITYEPTEPQKAQLLENEIKKILQS